MASKLVMILACVIMATAHDSGENNAEQYHVTEPVEYSTACASNNELSVYNFCKALCFDEEVCCKAIGTCACTPYPLGIAFDSNVHDVDVVHFDASSEYDRDYTAGEAKLNNIKYWAPGGERDDRDPFIQVEFSQSVLMSGIITQGSTKESGYEEWTESVMIRYGETEQSMEYIRAGNKPMVFPASTDEESLAEIEFPKPVAGKFLRIEPVDYHRWIALRFEVLGCPVQFPV